jgi:predicted transport protein
MKMLIINGVKYNLLIPKDEEKEFHPMVREHSKEIFGGNSLYFDVKHVLKTTSGIGSIPDAYVISLAQPYEWYVVENELSSHPVYDHIVKQLTKFINGIENQSAKNQIVDMLYDEINKDTVLRANVQKKVNSTDVYHFLSKLISKLPRIVVVIDNKTPDVEEACGALKYKPDIVEFKTFVGENGSSVHAHLFEPLSMLESTAKEDKRSVAAEKAWETRKSQVSITAEQHLDKIKNVKMREKAIQLRNAIKKISGDIEEYITREYIAFKRVSERFMFSYMYCQKRGFWFMVKVPRNEFNINGLDAREQFSGWTHIRANENTNLSLLIEAAKQAYERAEKWKSQWKEA